MNNRIYALDITEEHIGLIVKPVFCSIGTLKSVFHGDNELTITVDNGSYTYSQKLHYGKHYVDVVNAKHASELNSRDVGSEVSVSGRRGLLRRVAHGGIGVFLIIKTESREFTVYVSDETLVRIHEETLIASEIDEKIIGSEVTVGDVTGKIVDYSKSAFNVLFAIKQHNHITTIEVPRNNIVIVHNDIGKDCNGNELPF